MGKVVVDHETVVDALVHIEAARYRGGRRHSRRAQHTGDRGGEAIVGVGRVGAFDGHQPL